MFVAAITPWKDGEGWQNHDIATRPGETIRKVLDEIEMLNFALYLGEKLDWSVDLYKDSDQIAAFWLSDYYREGVVIDGLNYQASAS